MADAQPPRKPESPLWRFVVGFALGACTTIVMIMLLGPMCCHPPRGRARSVQCAAQLNDIGKAVQLHWAEDRRESYPADLRTLVESGKVKPTQLVCPEMGTSSGEVRCDYIYIAGLGDLARGSMMMAFEQPGNHRQEEVNYLTVGSSVGRDHLRDGAGGLVEDLRRINEHLAERRRALP